MNQDGTISTETAPDEVPFWLRANIAQAKYMRLAVLALRMADNVQARYKKKFNADINELRNIINGTKSKSKPKDQD